MAWKSACVSIRNTSSAPAAVLFSAVLAQFFSLYATANRFVRTVLVEADKEVKTWQPQAGSPLSL
ncbi:type VI secretion system baseplate subunit TssF [Pseudomonas aeruginosa]